VNAFDHDSLRNLVEQRQAQIFAEIADDRRADQARQGRLAELERWSRRSRLVWLLASLLNATAVIRS
jgi:hypothetical protein